MTVVRRRLVALSGLLSLFVLAAAGSSSAAPGDGSTGQISDVKSQPGVVQFVFSAGNLTPGDTLNPKSVLVSVDGRSLPATANVTQPDAHGAATPPREVILTLDVSGSMAGTGIAAARSAAVSYATELPADVRVGLVTFSNVPHVLLTPTTDRRALASAVNTVRAGGSTALYDGIVAAASVLGALQQGAIRRLVILSDGDDTSSTHRLSDATTTLVRNGIAADVVAFRLPGDQAVLDRIAAVSHGQVLPASSAGALAGAFATAAQAFKQQVLVTVRVPDTLAGKSAQLVTSATAGGQSVTARLQVTLPVGAATSDGVSPRAISQPAVAASMTTLWIVCGVVFLVIFVVALMGLYAPLTASARAGKQSRLTEVNRYRLVGAVGRPGPTPAAVPASSQSNLATLTLGYVDKAVRARGQREKLVSEVERAGLRIRPEEWAALQICTAVVFGVLLALLAYGPIGFIVGVLLGVLGCRAFIRIKTSRRVKEFEGQLPDTLQLLAGSLRSGFSLSQALTGVVREGTEPTASEFARALTEVRLGAELDDAMDRVADRMICADLSLVVMAMRISREVGGNLAEVLQNTVGTMRDRAQLRGLVRVLSAEGRISAKVLIGLPFLLAGYLLLFKPGYLSPLVTTGVGIVMLIGGSALLALGAFWLSRLVKIEV
ncbi:MAG: hypothetical protein DLM58_10330 [Pseudonocardiales bacterium]|nr:MAG: hypothetical protein DLM58_10330 [Pseudonocardiales bacterium]